MSHKPNLLSWDQDVAASPREFHETDNNRTNSAALLATWQYFSFRHIWFSKLLSHQKLSQIILSYFSNAFSLSKAKEVSRSPENYHLLQKWRTRKLPAILKNIDVWRDVTLVVISRPMFTLETLPPSCSLDSYFANLWPEMEFGELTEILSAASLIPDWHFCLHRNWEYIQMAVRNLRHSKTITLRPVSLSV